MTINRRGMISIKASLTELERCHAIAESHLAACRTLAEGLAGFESGIGDPETDAIGQDLKRVSETLPRNADTARQLLSDYRLSVANCVSELRRERSATERVLEELTASLKQADDDHDGRIRSTVENLRTVARSPEARGIRGLLGNAAQTIEQSVEKIQREHQTAIAQFHREIRDLQRRLTPEELPVTTGILTRPEIADYLERTQSGRTRILLLHVRGIRLAAEQFDDGVASQLAGAFVVRLRNLLPYSTAVGQWSEEKFVALLSSGSSASVATLCRSAAQNMSGPYGCLHMGKTARPSIEVTVCAMDSNSDAPAQLLERIDYSLSRI